MKLGLWLALGADFVRGDLVPTLVALAAAALREPMTWSVIGVACGAFVLHRRLARST